MLDIKQELDIKKIQARSKKADFIILLTCRNITRYVHLPYLLNWLFPKLRSTLEESRCDTTKDIQN